MKELLHQESSICCNEQETHVAYIMGKKLCAWIPISRIGNHLNGPRYSMWMLFWKEARSIAFKSAQQVSLMRRHLTKYEWRSTRSQNIVFFYWLTSRRGTKCYNIQTYQVQVTSDPVFHESTTRYVSMAT